MRIDFFEEYPTPENLAKAALISWPSTAYIAACSLSEFEKAGAALALIHPRIEAGYWPILKTSYWISPFSSRGELAQLRDELEGYRGIYLPVLIDLEFPILTPKLFLKIFFPGQEIDERYKIYCSSLVILVSILRLPNILPRAPLSHGSFAWSVSLFCRSMDTGRSLCTTRA